MFDLLAQGVFAGGYDQRITVRPEEIGIIGEEIRRDHGIALVVQTLVFGLNVYNAAFYRIELPVFHRIEVLELNIYILAGLRISAVEIEAFILLEEKRTVVPLCEFIRGKSEIAFAVEVSAVFLQHYSAVFVEYVSLPVNAQIGDAGEIGIITVNRFHGLLGLGIQSSGDLEPAVVHKRGGLVFRHAFLLRQVVYDLGDHIIGEVGGEGG